MAKKRRVRKRKGDRPDAGDVSCCLAGAVFDGCYVATAAHGDFEAPEVRTLRRYRDQRLRSHPLGRAFTVFYYRFGPYPAAVIERFPALRAPARQVLRPAVWWARRKVGPIDPR